MTPQHNVHALQRRKCPLKFLFPIQSRYPSPVLSADARTTVLPGQCFYILKYGLLPVSPDLQRNLFYPEQSQYALCLSHRSGHRGDTPRHGCEIQKVPSFRFQKADPVILLLPAISKSCQVLTTAHPTAESPAVTPSYAQAPHAVSVLRKAVAADDSPVLPDGSGEYNPAQPLFLVSFPCPP